MGGRASGKLRGGLGNFATGRGPPDWLSTPPQSESLGTDIPYNYLAAQLIRAGAVDVSSCADGGLMPEGGASTCGMEAARSAVTAWQNQFDSIILNVAKDTGVPAHLLKNLFAIESQFWPGRSLRNDIGLGQLTERGADTTLLWNSSVLLSVLSVGDGFNRMQQGILASKR